MKEGKQMKTQGLYEPSLEHDNCGIGAIIQMKGIKSHQVVEDALTIVEHLEHRAGKDASGQVGDGVGILLQIPHGFFQKVFDATCTERYGVGMFFLPNDAGECKKAQEEFACILENEGLHLLGWRKVPVHDEILHEKARAAMPNIYQAFIKREDYFKTDMDFDRKLYVIRRIFEKSSPNTYICSLSCRTIVYKGMFLVGQLREFYQDFHDSDFISAIALVHSRFSTNTFPSWQRAHPNRMIVHNGEINTIRGNVNKMMSREETMASHYFQKDMNHILPIVDKHGSDSAMLDNTIEFLVMAGIPLPEAVLLCIPEPWENDTQLSEEMRAYFQYNACRMEPWDGPASILFSDGEVAGAILDRNGLRPSRYYITKDDTLILSSEVGVLDIPIEDIVEKNRLRPGKMLLVDTKKGILIRDEEIKQQYAKRHPYAAWIKEHVIALKDIAVPKLPENTMDTTQLQKLQKFFDYSFEDIMKYILPFAKTGSEPVIAMGNDTPLAVLSPQHHLLFDYFKQRFAQVTNPAMDAIREEIVTSTCVYLGKEGNLLEELPQNIHLLKINHPILTKSDIIKIKQMHQVGFQVCVLPITYHKNISLKTAIEELFMKADKAIKDNNNILILSDRGVDENHIAMPSLLATSAMQQHLIKTKKRMQVAMILESAEPREVHHFATLLGYGASAIYPYLVHDTIEELVNKGILKKDCHQAIEDYHQGILHGVVKVASKMGISTIQSYQGAQVFEAIGINQQVIDEYFTDTISRIGGITLKEIEQEVQRRHTQVFDTSLSSDESLNTCGMQKSSTDKQQHLYNPVTIQMLQEATKTNDYNKFKSFTKMIDEELKPTNIRGLWTFDYTKRKPVSIDEVEPVETIVQRFKTGAMSYGSISKEAHVTLAIAMNRLHGKSNTGEGGEDEERFTIKDGVNTCSAIKQIASGRFGVTSAYLNHATEIQIKIAQGAKPGEGGQLPAKKVYPWIAKTRHSTPGVQLISPPPHHDIYSIEDLAQLIYDLKCVNKDARISVKLVSETGVGTIAAGVAKAGADVILISGHDGGTGAALKNSVYHAGMPWELGLSEVHQVLQMNELRHQVVLETDGKLMTGKDVIMAALLGAEEFGFATGPLVAMGCKMMRVCNLDTCPFGIATQNPKLRKRFTGKPEYVENFMKFIAQEMREYMAALGFTSVEEMIGHKEVIKEIDAPHIHLDFHAILNHDDANIPQVEKCRLDVSHIKDETQIWPQMQPYFEQKQTHEIQIDVNNEDRSFGAMFGSRITKAFGNTLAEDTFIIHAKGSGGQSFGAFIPKGLTIALTGDANDYFGKGLSGGKLIVSVDKKATFEADQNIIIGNVACYGATSGKVYINGIAGERFCVRNSGATVVVEGVGDHALEYMTGGCVVILGTFGKNIGAGMSGGVAYILDEQDKLNTCLYQDHMEVEPISASDQTKLKSMLMEHVAATDSKKAQNILANWDVYLPMFKKIIPSEYHKMISQIEAYQKSGMSKENAEYEAFLNLL
ncbi:glutamate synthase large subunit [Absiella sp. AM29-15]|uniref:glutamate synthase large subunit n=1 Tax=Absiella sp. AM29-15 TaxID=2292278 RepID=UPI000E40282F|nr:glutamate synthase large subunit [Absiella sp. AM29-15]RGC52014.1 glutamate synthase large subunit [Absiella sp. AM29-15]